MRRNYMKIYSETKAENFMSEEMADKLQSFCEEFERETGTVFGAASLFSSLIVEIKRHTKYGRGKTFKRG